MVVGVEAAGMWLSTVAEDLSIDSQVSETQKADTASKRKVGQAPLEMKTLH